MEVLIKLNNQTAGKDKIARLFQYLCRAIYDSLQKNEINLELIEKLKNLEYILSSYRKLLRFGKCVDVFYSSFVSIHYANLAHRITLTLSKISQALFLLADHFIWLARTNLFRNVNIQKWNQLANRYWLFSIIMNLVRDFYEITRLMDLHKRNRSRKCDVNDLADISKKTYCCIKEHSDVVVDTIKNTCDFFIPLNNLGYINVNPKVIGILGVVSSLAGLFVILQPSAKLVPM